MNQPHPLIAAGVRTIRLERDSIDALCDRIDATFRAACEAILACTGRVVVIGMGKSGHIGNKISATLASTGTPALFVHAAEASHGDIGMITEQDIVLAISNSGTTGEIVSLLPVLKRKGVPIISMTGNASSTLAVNSDHHLDVSVEKEACPLGLAPTNSTTAALVMGDALAMALLEARGFTADDFAFSHPGGNLGRRLLLKVNDIMHTGDDIPRVQSDTTLRDSLLEITAKKLGMTTVVDDRNTIVGVFTDGDLRRCLDQGLDINATPIRDIMTSRYKFISAQSLASEAARIMQDNSVYSLVVLDKEKGLEGIITMHDLLRANVV